MTPFGWEQSKYWPCKWTPSSVVNQTSWQLLAKERSSIAEEAMDDKRMHTRRETGATRIRSRRSLTRLMQRHPTIRTGQCHSCRACLEFRWNRQDEPKSNEPFRS